MIRVRSAAPAVTLEARIVGTAPASGVVAPPHPLYGGHFSNPVVMAICEGLQRRRISTLTFNWRGVGASSGRASGELDDACEDYRGALAHLVEGRSDATEVVAAGYSFGAVAALTVALDDPHVSEVVVVAPPTGYLPAELATRSRLRTLHVIAAEEDDFCDLDELEQALAGIPGTRITVIRGADHFFSRVGVDEIVAAVSTAP